MSHGPCDAACDVEAVPTATPTASAIAAPAASSVRLARGIHGWESIRELLCSSSHEGDSARRRGGIAQPISEGGDRYTRTRDRGRATARQLTGEESLIQM